MITLPLARSSIWAAESARKIQWVFMEISDEEEQHKIGNIGNDVEETSNTPTESATNRRREICRRRDCNLSFDSDGGGGFKTGVWFS